MRRIALVGAAAAAALAVGLSTAGRESGREQAPAAEPTAALAVSARVTAGPPARVTAGQMSQSVALAYSFLSRMMNMYAAGPTPRLVQSFAGGVLGRQHFTDSETYDDALIIDAYLARGTRADRSRAEVIGT